MALVVTVFVAVYAFGAVFVACELGQRITNAFDEIGDHLYQCDWHLFPIEIRRLTVILLCVLQQSILIQCFGSIFCTREVFKKVRVVSKILFGLFRHKCGLFFQVVNSSFSYFLMIQ